MEFIPLNSSCFSQLESLFGPNGACAGCCCTYWRQSNGEYQKNKGENNHRKFKALVERAQPLGILALVDQQAVGWCAVSPRSDLPRVENSRIMTIGHPQAWIIHCLFISKSFRKTGLSTTLIKKAYEYAISLGAKIVEAYPVEPAGSMADTFVWYGILSSFEQAGFEKVQRRSKVRWMVRKE